MASALLRRACVGRTPSLLARLRPASSALGGSSSSACTCSATADPRADRVRVGAQQQAAYSVLSGPSAARRPAGLAAGLGGGRWADGVVPAASLSHPWRGVGARGFAKAVRVSVDLEQVRHKDPSAMLTMFRKKCFQNNVQKKTRANRYHVKPNKEARQRKLSLPRRQVLHRVKGKVWNYLLTKKELDFENR